MLGSVADTEINNAAEEKIEDDETVNNFCNWKDMKLEEDHLRLVVMTENEKRLLFDSETVLAVSSTSTPPPNSQLSKCQRFYPRDIFLHCSEGKVLKESLSSESESLYSSVHSCDGQHRTHRSSQTMDPPEKFTRVRNASLQLDNEYPRPFSPQSLSTTRRKQLSHRGDICDENNCGRWSSRSRMSSCSSANDDEVNHVAIAVVFNYAARQFLLQHIPLIELEMLKLETQVVKACLTRTHYLSVIYQAWKEMVRSVCLLHNSPRIHTPVWLSLLEEEKYENVAEKFCSTLAELISFCDLKTTTYFLSNLISSVLINHLTWVASVAAPDICSKTRESFVLGTKLDLEVFRYPYNTQLAQYMEVCGSVGAAERLARTVILGDDMALVTKLIFVLSYFIRCSALRVNAVAADVWAHNPTVSVVPNEPKPLPVKNSLYYPPKSRFNETAALRGTVEDFAIEVAVFFFFLRHFCSICSQNTNLGFLRMRRVSNTICFAVLNGAKNRRRRGMEKKQSSEWEFPECEEYLRQAETMDMSLARSLIAGPCDGYCSHFVLSGLKLSSINMNEVRLLAALEILNNFFTISSMIDHVRNGESELFCPSSPDSSSSSAVSEPSNFKPTVIVVGDTSNFTVKEAMGVVAVSAVCNCAVGRGYCPGSIPPAACSRSFVGAVFSGDESSVEECQMSSPCESVVAMLEEFNGLYAVGTMPSTLISFVEDALGNILAKSVSLLEVVAGRDVPAEPSDMSSERVAKIIGCDCSDLRLISNVAAVYFPPVLNLLV
uniref:UDENN FNIP1/2-type domain-containing protein n=1 Tax=Syphacia muris TaxID=451379 RepID=A0A0N5AH85_9BILA